MWMLIDIRCVRMVLFYACYIVFMYTHVTCIHIYIYKILYYSCAALWTLWVNPLNHLESPVSRQADATKTPVRWVAVKAAADGKHVQEWLDLNLKSPFDSSGFMISFDSLDVFGFMSACLSLHSIFSSYLKYVGKSLYIAGWNSPSGYSLSGSSSQRECQVQLCGVGSWISVRVNVSK